MLNPTATGAALRSTDPDEDTCCAPIELFPFRDRSPENDTDIPPAESSRPFNDNGFTRAGDSPLSAQLERHCRIHLEVEREVGHRPSCWDTGARKES